MTTSEDPGRLAGLCRLLVFGALVALPLRVLGHGFLPSDDALRHAAKVVSGRTWAEILVLRADAPFDLHPGWHAFLSAVQRLTSWDAHALVLFAVTLAFVAFALPWVLLQRRPEAVLAALLLLNLMDPPTFARYLFGRPFLATAAALNLLLLLLPRLQREGRLPRGAFAALTLAVGLAVYVHPSFYLWGLPFVACLAARWWRAAGRALAAIAGGALLGGVFAGKPLGLLRENLAHGFATADVASPASLVGELRPTMPPPAILLLVAFLLLLRFAQGRPLGPALDTPVGWLAGLGWLLGFVSGRFWFDFGALALVHFLAAEVEEALPPPARATERLALSAAFCATFLITIGADTGGRWARPQDVRWNVLFQPSNPALPDRGGILFADNMDVFFQGFYRLPHAPWRYMVGFEQSIMPAQDRQVFRGLLAARPLRPPQLLEPWLRKMVPADRLVLETSGPHDPPPLPALDWTFVPPAFWSGRKPVGR